VFIFPQLFFSVFKREAKDKTPPPPLLDGPCRVPRFVLGTFLAVPLANPRTGVEDFCPQTGFVRFAFYPADVFLLYRGDASLYHATNSPWSILIRSICRLSDPLLDCSSSFFS